jgi:general secretion pathway protein A
MYQNFFGFKERPFKLVPNPAFLYLSRGHEEALAHLTYAISQGDGFVEITGEVGTGKTTLCRAFLENLSEEGLEAAFIFNPKLDEVQLLKAINDEFGIDSSADTSKELIDTLNSFLLGKKADGKKAILLIDEAQNLSKDVLEQLRLLSNLETTTSKLIQIILVGQPELGEMLDSHELRQLGQRITLSCHLTPLSLRETREYILHRLRVAARKDMVQFTVPAMASIYRYSGGIPRLINIACDRALLTAFGLNRKRVTAGIARSAVRELADRRTVKRIGFGFIDRKWILAATLGILFVVAGILYLDKPESDKTLQASTTGHPVAREKAAAPIPAPAPIPAQVEEPASSPVRDSEKKRPPDSQSANIQPVEEAEKTATPVLREEAAPQPDGLSRLLAGVDAATSRKEALRAALSLWVENPVMSPYLDGMEQDEEMFKFAARQNGLRIHRFDTSLDLLQKFNVPAVLTISLPQDIAYKFLTISRIEDGRVELRGGKKGDAVTVDKGLLELNWTGEAFVLWKNFLNLQGMIPNNTTRESIVNLKMLLNDIGFKNIEITPYYDAAVRDAVKVVQKRHGIWVDGIVGPVTKIALYNEKPSLSIPHITPVKTKP